MDCSENIGIHWENPQDANSKKCHYSEEQRKGYPENQQEPQGASAMIWLECTANGGELKGNHWEYTDNSVAWHSLIHNYGSFSTSHNTLSNVHHSNQLQQNADLSLK